MAKTTIYSNGRIATNSTPYFVEAIAVSDGKITSTGSSVELLRKHADATEVIDLGGRTVIPGLNDSHMHPIRGGLNYNMELRWDGVPSLADALRMLKDQAARTPAPQWVRVVGGWTEFQFAERRMPTLDEINAVAPDTPVFVMHLYDRALLNGAALRAVGYDKNAPDFPGGEVQRDRHGNIRELQNLIERSVIASTGRVLQVSLAGLQFQTPTALQGPKRRTLEEAEREHILATLKETKWVISGPNGAAAQLGMNRSTLQFRMRKLGILRARELMISNLV